MKLILINQTLTNTISQKESELRLIHLALKSNTTEELLKKKSDIEDELQFLKIRKRLCEKRKDFLEKYCLKKSNLEEYIRFCQEICADVKGIDFVPKQLKFRLRLRYKGEQVYLGVYDKWDDVISELEESKKVFFANL